MNELILRKNGGFYSVYGDDCYILFYLLGYKIVGDRVGFPISAYNKVVNTLEDNKISYTDKYNNKSNDYKRKNNYNKLLDLGKRKYSLNYRIDNIIEKMNLLNEEDIDNILSYIESYEIQILIVKRIKEFIFSIDSLVINLPRREFVVKNKLLSDSFDVLELIYIANGNKSKDVKLNILSKLSMLDFYLEYLYKKSIISDKVLKRECNLLSNITKMMYGWLKENVQ